MADERQKKDDYDPCERMRWHFKQAGEAIYETFQKCGPVSANLLVEKLGKEYQVGATPFWAWAKVAAGQISERKVVGVVESFDEMDPDALNADYVLGETDEQTPTGHGPDSCRVAAPFDGLTGGGCARRGASVS